MAIYREQFRTWLAATYRGRRHATKNLARAAETHPRTAENWLGDYCAPAVEPLLNLAARHPDLQAQINAWIDERRAALRQKGERNHADISRRLAASRPGATATMRG